MSEFDDISTELADAAAAETADTGDWDDFDGEGAEEIGADLGEALETPDLPPEPEGEGPELSDADRAADYARSLGFDKAGDYIARHYDGGEFVPGDPIPITTRNMALEGTESAGGIPFERRTVELTDGLSVEGVFPVFDSVYHVELGEEAKDMSLHQQFSACREDLQEHMFDSPELLQGLTLGDMERLELPQGYTPEGFTWQHDPETGCFDLVATEDHSVGHTGGNALWGS